MQIPLSGSCQCGANSPELAKLQAGTLEKTREVRPEVHIWVGSKQPWLQLAPDITCFDTQPEDPLEVLQAALDYRAAH